MYLKYGKLALPAAMQGLLMDFMMAVDLAMVGSLGAVGLAAVGIMSQPKMALLIIVRAFTVPVSAVIARRMGEKRYGEMSSFLRKGICITLIIYIPLLLMAATFLGDILYLAGVKDSYFEEAYGYGMMIVGSLLFGVVSQIIGAGLIGIGDTKRVFAANGIGNVINTMLNYILIFGHFGFPKLGVLGAGIGTLIGAFVTMLLLLSVVLRNLSPLNLRSATGWLFRGEDLKVFFSLGSASLGEQVFERTGMFIYTKMVASLGVVALASHHVAMNLCDIFYSFDIGLGYASTSITGQCMGAEEHEKALTYGKIGIRLGILIAVPAMLIYYFLRYPLIGIFTEDKDVIREAAKIIVIVAVVCIPQTFQLVYAGVLKGAGDNLYVMKYSLLSIAIMRPIITYLLCFSLGLGLMGAWISLLIDQSTRMLFAAIRYRSRKWMDIRI